MTDEGRARIDLCGRLAVELQGRRLEQELRGRQGKLCFAYLALNRDRAVGREELIGALWPEAPPSDPGAALATLVSRLRSVLGAERIAGRSELRLAFPAGTRVDTELAFEALNRAESALADRDFRGAWGPANLALTIARRQLLPGFEAPWIEERRREMEEVALRALEAIARIGLALGGSELAAAERAGRELVERSVYRESAHMLLMEALAARGNVAEALTVYERLRSLLREELGTTPGPAVKEVHARLLRGEAVSPASAEVPGGMSLPPALGALSQSRFVGRSHELSRLRELWDAARRGASGLVLVYGEAGIGKTRLAGELARMVDEEAATVLYGRCDPEPLVPYQPFVEALDRYVAHAPPSRLERHAGTAVGELSRMLPRLAERLPDAPEPAPGDPESERFRLFEAVASLLRNIAGSPGLLLVLDDLHWADRPTLLLLRHVLRSPEHAALLVVGTYRQEGELPYALAEAMNDLRRDRLLYRVAMEGLSEHETAGLMQTLGDSLLPSELAHSVHGATRGNPFFVEELTRYLSETGVAEERSLERIELPEGVREVIARRLVRLGADAREALRVASVVGGDFEADVLERVLAVGRGGAAAAIDQARAAGLVVQSGERPGRFAFTHALVRAALLGELEDERRRRVHLQVAEALAQRPPTDARAQLAALAHHYFEAIPEVDPALAADHCARAGDMASALLAYEEAEEHYGRALEALARFDGPDEERESELQLALGTARMRAGDGARAREAFLVAAELARRVGDARRLARAALGYGVSDLGSMGQTVGAVDPHLLRLLEEALAALPAADEELAARVRARLAVELYYWPDSLERRKALTEEAVAIAQRRNDPATLGFALAARRYALGGPANLEERIEATTAAARLAEGAGDPELAVHAHAWLVVDLLEQGDLAGVQIQMGEHARRAAQLRQPFHLRWVRLFGAMLAMLRGRFAEGERLADQALELGQRLHPENAMMGYAVQLFAIRQGQGRLAELEPVVAGFVERYPALAAWRAALAMMYAELDRPAQARSELERIGAEGLEGIPQDINYLVALNGLARASMLVGEARWAQPLYERLAPYAQRNIVAGYGLACLGSCSRPLGALALTLGRVADAVRHFEDALAMASAAGARPETAHIQHEYARALLARGQGSTDRERAAALVDEAWATARELGMKGLERRAGELRPAVSTRR